MRRFVLVLGVWLAAAGAARGSVQTFVDDYAGFQAAAGAVHVIDFETLPDGSPTHAGIPITNSYNYDSQGAHFSAPLGQIQTTGNNLTHNPLLDYAISVGAPAGQRTWITVDLMAPSSAIGVFFPGNDTIYAYSEGGVLLAQPNIFFGGDHFIGITSDVPIARVVGDPGDDASGMFSFFFTPVPEPATGALAIMAYVCLRRRCARRVGD